MQAAEHFLVVLLFSQLTFSILTFPDSCIGLSLYVDSRHAGRGYLQQQYCFQIISTIENPFFSEKLK